MNRRDLLLWWAVLCAAGTRSMNTSAGETVSAPAPPVAQRIPKHITQLGRERVDDYAWLRDPDYQQVLKDPSRLKPEIRGHLEAENAYSAAVLAPTLPVRAKLLEEMRSRMPAQDATPEQADGPWLYIARYAPNAQQPVFLRRPRTGEGAEQALLDANALAAFKPFFHIVKTLHSPDHALFAYAVDEKGSEYYSILTIDAATGKKVGASVENAHGSFVFSPDSKWLFWVGRDDNGRPSRVFRRPVRGGVRDTQLVFHEKDEGLSLTLALSSDRELILISSANQQTSEILFLAKGHYGDEPRLILARRDGVIYRVDRWNGQFVVLTNADQAVDYKIVRAGGSDLVPHRPGRYIMDMIAFPNYLVRLERVDATERIVVMHADGREDVLDFKEEAFALALDRGYEFASTLRFIYQSPVTPRQ